MTPEFAPQARRLNGNVALITGAAGGIGRAIALRLSAEGAHVALFDLRPDGVADTAAAVADAGGTASTFVVDATDRDALSAAMDDIVAAHGRLDIAVNNAGIGKPVAFLEIDDQDWARIIATNLGSVFLVGQEAARRMVPAGRGRIVNIASLAAHTANDRQAAYAASKGGVVSLTRVMAFELAPHGIAVNAISPGPIDTELAAAMLTPEARAARERRIPQGRLGLPDDVAAGVAFLASPDAAYVNGQVLVIDGGLLVAGIRERQ